MGNKTNKTYKKKNPIEKEKSIQEKLNKLSQIQTELLEFNIGGEIFKVSKSTVQESRYTKSFFMSHIKSTGEIFLDRSPLQFDLFIQILRSSSTKVQSLPTAYFSIKERIKDKYIFRDDLQFYFRENVDEVVKDFDLGRILNFNDINSQISSWECLSLNNDTKLKYMFYKADKLSQLFKPYSQKGFFFKEGGGLVLSLNKDYYLDRIELRPFILDRNFWQPSDCEFIEVFISLDKTNWESVGNIQMGSSNLTEEDCQRTFYFPMKRLRHVNLSTENHPQFKMSISYIKLYEVLK